MPSNPSAPGAAQREARVNVRHDVRVTFNNEVREIAGALGPAIPAWTPDREKVPEDSILPG